MQKNNKLYVWVDCESTGVEFDGTDEIIEIAAVVTDTDYKQIGDPFESLVQPSNDWIGKMNSYVRKMHTANGLINDVVSAWGDYKIQPDTVELSIVKWLYDTLCYPKSMVHGSFGSTDKKIIYGPDIKQMLVLAGASVGADEKWMRQQVPEFQRRLHYRINDVSGLKGFIEDFDPDFVAGMQTQKSNHRALDDVYKEINEIKQIRNYMEVDNEQRQQLRFS